MSVVLDNLSNKPTGYYESNREDMLKYIPQGIKTSLEFGCGFGRFSALVKERFGAEAWAVEIDKKSAKAASEKLDKVINSDAHEAIDKLPDNYFDCVILFDILEHLVDPYLLLISVKKKLTENGVVVTSIPNIRYYRTLVSLVIPGDWDYKGHGILDKTHLRFFTYKSIVKMFNELGFEILLIEGIHPTSSRNFRLLNMLLLNSLSDIKYKHFAAVAKPKLQSK